MKRLFVLLLTTVIVVTSLIPVSAMDVDALAYSKVNIADYLIGKEFVDNDVRLTYSVPVAPYTEIGGVTRDGITEQFDQTTYVDFRNGKISVPFGEELLHSWDFTQSYVDSITGVSAEPDYSFADGLIRNEQGLTFGWANSCLNLYTDAEHSTTSLQSKTVDIDILDASFSFENGVCPLFGIASTRWRTGNKTGWVDTGSYFGWYGASSDFGWGLSTRSNGIAEPLLYPNDVSYLDNKTIRLVFDNVGYCHFFIAPLGTNNYEYIATFDRPYFQTGLGFNTGILTLGNFSTKNENFFNGTITGVRIYDNTALIDINKYIKMNFDMLIMGTHYFEDVRVIDIADLRAGSEFDISFMLENALTIDGTLQVPDGTAFEIQYLDKDFQKLSLLSIPLEVTEAELVDGNSWSYTFDGLVPRGAKYMFLQLTCHGMQVEDADAFTWIITALNMSFNISALEDQSKTQQQILNKLDDVADMLTPTPEQSDKADQMEDAIGDAADKLENNNSSLGQLTPTRPQINTDLQLDPDKLLAVSPLVTNIWSINGLGRMISIVLVVATVAYIFFGKRDG